MYAWTVPEQDEIMTDAVSNTDDIEPAEGDEIIDDDDAGQTDDSNLHDPLEGFDESDEDDTADGDVSPDGAVAGAEDGAHSEDDGDAEALALRVEFDELNDRHLRLAAEFNNFRRRTEQQRLESWTRAQADLVEKFLDVLDDLHRVADLLETIGGLAIATVGVRMELLGEPAICFL